MDVDLEKLVKDQAKVIKSLQVAVASMADRLPAEPAAADAGGGEFPRLMYRKQHKVKAGQIDHPGYDAKKAKDQAHFDALIEEGWSGEAPSAFVYPDPDEEPAPKADAKKPGKK
jgi:hypothetical protein